jgi:hypothetical protein
MRDGATRGFGGVRNMNLQDFQLTVTKSDFGAQLQSYCSGMSPISAYAKWYATASERRGEVDVEQQLLLCETTVGMAQALALIAS